MKRLLALSTLTLSLSACSLFAPSTVEFHNRVVAEVNESSLALEQSLHEYSQAIPSEVNEETRPDLSSMQVIYQHSNDELEDVLKLLELEGKNLKQVDSARLALATYLKAAQAYQDQYQKILTYYSQSPLSGLEQVAPLNEALYTHYNTFTEANNDLVEVMASFLD